MRRRIGKLLIAGLLVSIGLAGAAGAKLTARIDGIIGRDSQKKVRFSVRVVRGDTGKSVYSHNAGEAFIPASNMKIITTAAALKFLGADFEYKTRAALCSERLVIIGCGDPLLGDEATDAKYGKEPGWIFEEIAAALKRQGVSKVKGITVDSTVFDDERVHPNWPSKQLNRWYAAEICGLNYNGNCVRISAETVGGGVVVTVEPRTKFLEVSSKIEAASSGRSVIGSYRRGPVNKVVVFGKCNKKAPAVDVAIEKPAAFFGYLLAEHLATQGIKADGKLLEKAVDADCDLKVVAEFGHSIEDCLWRCNKDSFGLAAEALLKTIAARSMPAGKYGGWDGGRKVVSKYLRDIGVPPGQFYIDDASGLSRQNKLSANAITRVLVDVYRSGNWALYKDSLAAGGVDGTVGKYFREAKYKGRILGKTGYISGVKSLSGVCCTKAGDYLFSILANGANGRTRDAINNIAKAIIDSEEEM